MKTADSIVDMQNKIQASADQLEHEVEELQLPHMLEALKKQYPTDVDTEAIKEDWECPPVAWEIHNEVANAKILLEEAVASLRKAAQQTPRSVSHEWHKRRLEDIKDPATRALLQYLLKGVG